MDAVTTPYTLSIEDTEGHSFLYGLHLGTNERFARLFAESRFHTRVMLGMPVVTVALMLNGHMVDCYDGHWFSGYEAPDDEC